MKEERIKIRLNRVTLSAIKKIKLLKYNDEEIPLPDSYIIEKSYEVVKPYLSKLDWQKINEQEKDIIIRELILEEDSLATTLTLKIDVLNGINEFKNRMVKETGGRVFFSYAVKILVLTHLILLDNNMDIADYID